MYMGHYYGLNEVTVQFSSWIILVFQEKTEMDYHMENFRGGCICGCKVVEWEGVLLIIV